MPAVECDQLEGTIEEAHANISEENTKSWSQVESSTFSIVKGYPQDQKYEENKEEMGIF